MAQAWAAVGAAIGVTASFAPAAAAEAPAPLAHAAGVCHVGSRYNKLGPTYVESLKVSGTSCATGMSLIKGYNRCRLKAGGVKGYCHSRVLGFSCSEKRSPGPVQFLASVRCTKGREVVTFTYSENT